MKIRREEFKEMLKECLQELIADGALNHLLPQLMPQVQQMAPNPMVHYAAQQIGRNPAEVRMMEGILADTAATTMQMQANAPDPLGMMAGLGGQQQYYPQQYPQQPQMNPQYVHVPQAAPLQMAAGPQQPQGQGTNNWARLAFNSPIRNRPGQDGGGGSGGHLPGQNMGKFG